MDLGTLLTSSLTDTLGVSLPHFRTELTLSATIVLVLLCRMLPVLRWLDSGFVAMGGVAFALWYAWCDFRGLPGSPWATIAATQPGSLELFGGLLVFDSLTAYIRLLLCGFLVLYILFTKVSGIPDREDGADFYTLVLGSSLGMCLMASANHLLMLSMASVFWPVCSAPVTCRAWRPNLAGSSVKGPTPVRSWCWRSAV
jgi:NADH-quinone oxidoreductase subunit N